MVCRGNIPVRMDDSANATSVVAIISVGRSSPISRAILFAMIWKNGYAPRLKLTRDTTIGNEKWTNHYFDHHATISSSEAAPAKGIYEL